MTKNFRTTIALATAVVLAMGTAAIAQTATPDAKPPVKKAVKHHAHKSMTPASDRYLRAAGSEPAPKAAK
jgi:hypothetical protein